MENRKSGTCELLYVISLAGIIAGLTFPLFEGWIVPRKARAYAEQRYGDHKAPLTQEEKDEWFYEMGVKSGKKPYISQYQHFNHNCRNHVFFGKSPRY